MATTITANGINFPDGSASAPSIGGTDTNTGLFTGSDIVGFATGGVERIRIDANGVLKITGQTSSIETAGITHHTNNNLYIRGGTTGAILQSVDGNEAWIVQNDYVSASTGGSERLRITSDGKIGVGEAAPNHIFHIKGSTPILAVESSSWASGVSAALRLSYTDGNAREIRGHYDHGFQFFLNPGEVMRINTSGKIRVGSGNPVYNFEVQNSGFVETLVGSTNASGAGIILDGDSNGDGNGGDYAQIFHQNDGTLNFRARNGSGGTDTIFLSGTSERLRITSAGRVGIGVATPGCKLNIKADGSGSDGLQVTSSGHSSYVWQIQNNDNLFNGSLAGELGIRGSSGISFSANAGSSTHFRITSAGLFGFNNSSPGGACIDATHSRTNAYGTTSDHRGLAQIVARNTSDAAGRFASISLVSGGGTQAEASINLVQTGNYQGDLTFKSRTAVSAWTEKMRISADKGLLLLGTTDTSGYNNRCAYFDNGNHGDNWNYVSITGSTSGGAGIVFGDSTGQDGGNYESYIYHNNNGNDFSIVTDRGNKEFRFKQGGDLSIIDGNLALASGHGIDFSATSDAANNANVAELLDDYEEGRHIVSITGSSSNPTVNLTMPNLWYVKVGSLVTLSGELRWTTSSHGSGTLRISLPFAAKNLGTGHSFQGTAQTWNIDWKHDQSSTEYIVSEVGGNNSYMFVRCAANDNLLENSLNLGSNVIGSANSGYGVELCVSLSYRAE